MSWKLSGVIRIKAGETESEPFYVREYGEYKIDSDPQIAPNIDFDTSNPGKFYPNARYHWDDIYLGEITMSVGNRFNRTDVVPNGDRVMISSRTSTGTSKGNATLEGGMEERNLRIIAHYDEPRLWDCHIKIYVNQTDDQKEAPDVRSACSKYFVKLGEDDSVQDINLVGGTGYSCIAVSPSAAKALLSGESDMSKFLYAHGAVHYTSDYVHRSQNHQLGKFRNLRTNKYLANVNHVQKWVKPITEILDVITDTLKISNNNKVISARHDLTEKLEYVQRCLDITKTCETIDFEDVPEDFKK